jgi:nitrogen fixation protein
MEGPLDYTALPISLLKARLTASGTFSWINGWMLIGPKVWQVQLLPNTIMAFSPGVDDARL